MPNLNQFLAQDITARILCYGPPKSRKTWWAATAASAGFNVLIIAGDKNYAVLNQLPAAAKSRVFILDWSDNDRPVFSRNITQFLSTNTTTYWDDKTKNRMFKPELSSIKLNKSTFDNNWVIILDTYTALAWSLLFQFCIENNQTMEEVQKPGNKLMQESYRYTGILATWAIQEFKKLGCHLIVVAHQDSYEKRIREGKNERVVFTRTQVKSTSGPHAMQLAKDFTDVFYFTINGPQVLIDTQANADRDGGSTLIPPGMYDWNKFDFSMMAQQAGLILPPKDLPLPTDFLLTTQTDIDIIPKGMGLLNQPQNNQPILSNQHTTLQAPMPGGVLSPINPTSTTSINPMLTLGLSKT